MLSITYKYININIIFGIILSFIFINNIGINSDNIPPISLAEAKNPRCPTLDSLYVLYPNPNILGINNNNVYSTNVTINILLEILNSSFILNKVLG